MWKDKKVLARSVKHETGEKRQFSALMGNCLMCSRKELLLTFIWLVLRLSMLTISYISVPI